MKKYKSDFVSGKNYKQENVQTTTRPVHKNSQKTLTTLVFRLLIKRTESLCNFQKFLHAHKFREALHAQILRMIHQRQKNRHQNYIQEAITMTTLCNVTLESPNRPKPTSISVPETLCATKRLEIRKIRCCAVLFNFIC